MLEKRSASTKNTRQYAVYGAVFGLMFPVGSTLLQLATGTTGVTWAGFLDAQRTSALLWVIDTAPIFLGLFAAMAGRRQDAVEAAMHKLEGVNTTLGQANRDLLEASQLKSQFLANMSHELRTPLNAIIGFSRIVLRKTKSVIPERQAENLRMVHESGKHLLEMVNDLLDIERIEAGMMRVSPSEVSVDQIAANIVARLTPAANEKKLQLHVRVEPPPLTIETDPARLRQILDNLVNNAIKYSDSGNITLRIFRDDSHEASQLRFAVADEGIGIPTDQLERIFVAFHQVDGSTTRAQGGVGLGLHLVQKLARLLDGTVEVESEVGKGSTFTFVFPAEKIVREEVATAVEAPPGEGEGPLVLVIDDQLSSVELIRSELLEHGFRVHSAMTGQDGLEKASRLRPDAIVLDIVMPNMDGWAVLRELRASPELCAIPVVVASVLNDVPMAFDLGIKRWLTKPVTSSDLRDVLAEVEFAPHDDILVVEDNPPTLALIREQLEEIGAPVRYAMDGPAAVSAFKDRMPKAVILDLMLPKMDGFEVLERLRALPEGGGVPVFVYTARELDDTDRQRLNGGLVRIVSKGESNGLNTVVDSVKHALGVGPE